MERAPKFLHTAVGDVILRGQHSFTALATSGWRTVPDPVIQQPTDAIVRTDVIAEHGHECIAKVMDLTGGEGAHIVLEAVGHLPAYEQAYGIVRPGGIISRVGVPQYEDAPIGFGSPLDDTAAGYAAMDDRRALKVMLTV